MSERGPLIACVASAVGGVLLSVYLHSPWTPSNIYSDIASFWGRGWVVSGQLPYTSASTFFEYPPISGLTLYLSRMVGGNYDGYYLAFSASSVVAAALLGWSTWRLARAVGAKANALFFLLPSMLVYGVYNFDLFNALFIVLGLQLFAEKRTNLSAAAIGLSVATKLVAVVLIPVLLLELGGWKVRARYIIVTGLVAGAFLLPIAVFNFGFFGQFLSFFSAWGLEDAWYIWIFGNPFSSAAKAFGFVLLGILLLRVYTLKIPMVQRSFLALGSYLLSTYIYAPQFNVTLIPLLAVVAVDVPLVFLMEVFNAMIILTWFTVPATSTGGPTYPGTVPQLMALLRSASLALVAVSVASNSGKSLLGWIKGSLGLQKNAPRASDAPTPVPMVAPADFDRQA